MSSTWTGLRGKAGLDKTNAPQGSQHFNHSIFTGLCGSHNRCICGSKGTPVVNQETKVERGGHLYMNSLEKIAGGHFYISFCPWGDMYEKWEASLGRQQPRLTRKKTLRSDATAKWKGDDRATIQGASHVIRTQNKKERESCFVWKRLNAKTSEVHNCQGESKSRLRGRSIALRTHKASSFSLSLLRSLHLSFSFLTRLARKLFPQPIPHRNAHCK